MFAGGRRIVLVGCLDSVVLFFRGRRIVLVGCLDSIVLFLYTMVGGLCWLVV